MEASCVGMKLSLGDDLLVLVLTCLASFVSVSIRPISTAVLRRIQLMSYSLRTPTKRSSLSIVGRMSQASRRQANMYVKHCLEKNAVFNTKSVQDKATLRFAVCSPVVMTTS